MVWSTLCVSVLTSALLASAYPVYHHPPANETIHSVNGTLTVQLNVTLNRTETDGDRFRTPEPPVDLPLPIELEDTDVMAIVAGASTLPNEDNLSGNEVNTGNQDGNNIFSRALLDNLKLDRLTNNLPLEGLVNRLQSGLGFSAKDKVTSGPKDAPARDSKHGKRQDDDFDDDRILNFGIGIKALNEYRGRDIDGLIEGTSTITNNEVLSNNGISVGNQDGDNVVPIETQENAVLPVLRDSIEDSRLPSKASLSRSKQTKPDRTQAQFLRFGKRVAVPTRPEDTASDHEEDESDDVGLLEDLRDTGEKAIQQAYKGLKHLSQFRLFRKRTERQAEVPVGGSFLDDLKDTTKEALRHTYEGLGPVLHGKVIRKRTEHVDRSDEGSLLGDLRDTGEKAFQRAYKGLSHLAHLQLFRKRTEQDVDETKVTENRVETIRSKDGKPFDYILRAAMCCSNAEEVLKGAECTPEHCLFFITGSDKSGKEVAKSVLESDEHGVFHKTDPNTPMPEVDEWAKRSSEKTVLKSHSLIADTLNNANALNNANLLGVKSGVTNTNGADQTSSNVRATVQLRSNNEPRSLITGFGNNANAANNINAVGVTLDSELSNFVGQSSPSVHRGAQRRSNTEPLVSMIDIYELTVQLVVLDDV